MARVKYRRARTFAASILSKRRVRSLEDSCYVLSLGSAKACGGLSSLFRQRCSILLFFSLAVIVVPELFCLPLKHFLSMGPSGCKSSDNKIVEQLFTPPKAISTPCDDALDWHKTRSLGAARERCLQIAGCTGFDRNYYTGVTLFCSSSYRKKSMHMQKSWASSDLGGCHGLHDEVIPRSHEATRNLTNCGLLGTAYFNFEYLLIDSICDDNPGYEFTHSLQDASLRCLATNCLFFAREIGGKTTFCSDHLNTSAVKTHSAMVRRKRYSVTGSRVGFVADAGYFRSQVLKDLRFNLNNGQLKCFPEQVLLKTMTTSTEHAAMICAAEPYCTLFSRDSNTQETIFCQGFEMHVMSALGKSIISGLVDGCEMYSGESSLAEAVSTRLPLCKNYDPSCGEKLYHIPVMNEGFMKARRRVVCDECPTYGLCPRLRVSRRFERAISSRIFANTLEDVANSLMHGGETEVNAFGALNPSIFQHLSRQYVAFRVSNAIRCSGRSERHTWQVDERLQAYQSHVVICQTNPSTFSPVRKSCVRIRIPSKDFAENMEGVWFDTHSSFAGPEDPRGFSFGGKMMIICNIGIERFTAVNGIETTSTSALVHERRMFLLVLQDLKVERLICLDFGRGRHDVKNVVPIESGEGLHLIFSLFPYKICRLDLDTGKCVDVTYQDFSSQTVKQFNKQQTEASLSLKKLGAWRGSTPFVKTTFGLLGVIHRKQDLELGRLYTHKWMVLDDKFPYVPIWMSEPFRFPAGQLYDDIQFASGLNVDEATEAVAVSYGVADCVSAIGVFELPKREILRAIGNFPLQQTLQIIRPLPRKEHSNMEHSLRTYGKRYVLVRWDGPVSDHTSFASVAREICAKLLQHPEIKLIIRDPNPDHVDPDIHQHIYSHIVTSNEELAESPDIVIRYAWPPNFQPIPSGTLIIYLPWEFFHIPESWVEMLNANVDEVWAPSAYVKEGFEDSGVTASKIYVVRHGVKDSACATSQRSPDNPALLHLARQDFALRLLYHGGALWRKGIDTVLKAYHAAFSPGDKVVLIINSLYGDESVKDWITTYLAEHKEQMADVEIITSRLTDLDVLQLYRTSDLLIHLSRSEGFGLAIIEAMSQGLPILIPQTPPMTDFVTQETGYLVPSFVKVCDQSPCFENGTFFKNGDWKVPKQLFWHEVDIEDAARALRDIFNNKHLLDTKKKKAKKVACELWRWDDTVHDVLDRIRIYQR